MHQCILFAADTGKGQGKGSFIVMEYLNFGGSYSQADLGQALAEMHKAEPAVIVPPFPTPTPLISSSAYVGAQPHMLVIKTVHLSFDVHLMSWYTSFYLCSSLCL